jgi:hypothetical protein
MDNRQDPGHVIFELCVGFITLSELPIKAYGRLSAGKHHTIVNLPAAV